MLTVHDILGPEGRIAARLSGYELRSSQLEMADEVAAAIQQRNHLVVEAGTGVGKSFAYLIPAILAVTDPDRALEDRPRRVIISTHTISLQEQLMEKDIPLLSSIIPREFTSVLVKGRSNYLSRRRLKTAQERSISLFSDEEQHDQLQRLANWSNETVDGSLSDLPNRPLSNVWDEVSSDHGNCMGRKCPTHDSCFYYKARRRIYNAQILVVNHALFFSDLALRERGASLLPDYDVVVLDEAHTIEQVAGDHLGMRVSTGQISYALNKLYNDRTNRGLLVHHQLGQAQQEVDQCRFLMDDFFQSIRDWMDSHQTAGGRIKQSEIVKNNISPTLDRLAQRMRRYGIRIEEESISQDFLSAANRMDTLAGEIHAWLTQQRDDAVYWVEDERKRRTPRTTLSAAPIEIGPILQEHLFSQVPTVIMTSATLSTGEKGSFDFFKSRIGLQKTKTLQLGSVFDYQQQMKLILMRQMPDPTRDAAGFLKTSVEMIRRYVEMSDGHAFVLFTSYDFLRKAASGMSDWLAAKKMTLYSQADGLPRSQMLEQFKANPRSVLFGTDSFWQGVDVPGDALQNVIITKLPFSVPDQPLLSARLDAIRARGGNPFREFQLPQAVIKLKQGFGRLIRSKRDTGMVVILDPRVLTKSYGKQFLESLPNPQIEIHSPQQMILENQ